MFAGQFGTAIGVEAADMKDPCNKPKRVMRRSYTLDLLACPSLDLWMVEGEFGIYPAEVVVFPTTHERTDWQFSFGRN